MEKLDAIQEDWRAIVMVGNHIPHISPSDPFGQRQSNELRAFIAMLYKELPGSTFELRGNNLIINGTIVITP